MKKRILVESTLSKDYYNFLEKMFGDIEVTVFSPKSEKFRNDADMIFLTGGADVTPSYYGDSTGKHTMINERRDEVEQFICKMYSHLPKLGICRGSQFLTVMAGGKLVQHVTGHGQAHEIQTNAFRKLGSYKTYEISSTHHQMMYPFSLPKERYNLIAWSKYFRSDVYLDGSNKNMELEPEFLEPEIVYYNNINALGIQGHPEFPNTSEHTLRFIKQLINNYLFK